MPRCHNSNRRPTYPHPLGSPCRDDTLVSWGCCDKLPKLSGLKPHIFITSYLEARCPHRAKTQGWAGLLVSGSSRGEYISCLFQLLEVPLEEEVASSSIFTVHPSAICTNPKESWTCGQASHWSWALGKCGDHSQLTAYPDQSQPFLAHLLGSRRIASRTAGGHGTSEACPAACVAGPW